MKNISASRQDRNRGKNQTNNSSELLKQLQSSALKYIGNYVLGQTIGDGTYGKVKLAQHKLTSQWVAIKIVDKIHAPTVVREIETWRHLRHPYIIPLYEVLVSETKIYMVMEYCPHGEMFDYITRKGAMSEPEARRYFKQMTLAIQYCHDKNYVHRDLKLENLLMGPDGNLRVIDFGFTREYENKARLLETFCGSSAYAAPEMITASKYTGPEADVWSMGILLYSFLCGYLPFDDDNEVRMHSKVLALDYTIPEGVSSDAQDLIRSMLQVDPKNRIPLETILKHPWLTSEKISSAPESPGPARNTDAVSGTESTLNETDLLHPTSIVGEIDLKPSSPVLPAVELDSTNDCSTRFHSSDQERATLGKLLGSLGFDIDSILHSVDNDLCDQGSALYWLLLAKVRANPDVVSTLYLASLALNDWSNNENSVNRSIYMYSDEEPKVSESPIIPVDVSNSNVFAAAPVDMKKYIEEHTQIVLAMGMTAANQALKVRQTSNSVSVPKGRLVSLYESPGLSESDSKTVPDSSVRFSNRNSIKTIRPRGKSEAEGSPVVSRYLANHSETQKTLRKSSLGTLNGKVYSQFGSNEAVLPEMVKGRRAKQAATISEEADDNDLEDTAASDNLSKTADESASEADTDQTILTTNNNVYGVKHRFRGSGYKQDILGVDSLNAALQENPGLAVPIEEEFIMDADDEDLISIRSSPNMINQATLPVADNLESSHLFQKPAMSEASISSAPSTASVSTVPPEHDLRGPLIKKSSFKSDKGPKSSSSIKFDLDNTEAIFPIRNSQSKSLHESSSQTLTRNRTLSDTDTIPRTIHLVENETLVQPIDDIDERFRSESDLPAEKGLDHSASNQPNPDRSVFFRRSNSNNEKNTSTDLKVTSFVRQNLEEQPASKIHRSSVTAVVVLDGENGIIRFEDTITVSRRVITESKEAGPPMNLYHPASSGTINNSARAGLTSDNRLNQENADKLEFYSEAQLGSPSTRRTFSPARSPSASPGLASFRRSSINEKSNGQTLATAPTFQNGPHRFPSYSEDNQSSNSDTVAKSQSSSTASVNSGSPKRVLNHSGTHLGLKPADMTSNRSLKNGLAGLSANEEAAKSSEAAIVSDAASRTQTIKEEDF